MSDRIFNLRVGTSIEQPFGKRFFEVVEVVYGKKGKPIGFVTHTPLGTTEKELLEDVELMVQAFKQPVIDLDNFPNLYNGEENKD
jgi:hypothetical protein